MWKKVAVGGAVTAAIVGAGTTAVALTGSDSPTPSSTSSSSSSAPGQNKEGRGHGRHPLAHLGNVLHGQWVTKNKDGKLVTHDEIHGTVTAVSATSITVKASDGVSQTYVITSDTKVRQRTKGKPRSGDDSDISKVHNGDNVAVLGTGTGPLTATAVIDIAE